MINTDKLKGRIREKRKTQKDCAERLGIKSPTFNQKLNNVRPLSLEEARMLQIFLDISDSEFIDYFFCRICCDTKPDNQSTA